ncbi:MAG TPA: hypothetical protein PKY59_04785 [Pyrinomonadaceae bacterium]|nr:hypothetical protein [Pyrinomonadaceae bacterium]
MGNAQSEEQTNSEHCCELMKTRTEFVCEKHESPFDCADSLIYYSKRFNEYGLIIHDSGSSFIKIDFCPFCGKKLPKSKR